MGILDYCEKANDATKMTVRNTEKFYDFALTKPLTYGVEYEVLLNDILKSDLGRPMNAKNLPSIPRASLYQSAALWEALGLHLHQIPMIGMDAIIKKNGKLVLTSEAASHIKLIEPHKLPVAFIKNDNCYIGVLKNINLWGKGGKVVLYNKIFLSEITNRISLCVYNHEITHTQMDGANLGHSYLNVETLPMIIEEILASHIDATGDTLKLVRNYHLREVAEYLHCYALSRDMDYRERIITDGYIQAIIEAIYLVNQYLTATDRQKREFLNYCNKIFDHRATVTEMLDFYDANLEQVPKTLQKLRLPKNK